MKTLLFFPIVLLAYFDGCSKSNTEHATFELNDTISLAYRTTYINADKHLTIRFDSVLEDSRCPPEAMCVWAGNAKVRFIFATEAQTDTFVLNTTLDSDKLGHRELLIQGYKIRLIGLSPQPVSRWGASFLPTATVCVK